MADTRKEKLQAMLDAIEASKANMGKQQLMEVLRKKEAAKQSIIPEDMRREPEYEAAPATVGEPQRVENLPFTEGSQQVVKPLPYLPGKKEKKTRLYRMMQ
jgi:hypothetical protein